MTVHKRILEEEELIQKKLEAIKRLKDKEPRFNQLIEDGYKLLDKLEEQQREFQMQIASQDKSKPGDPIVFK